MEYRRWRLLLMLLLLLPLIFTLPFCLLSFYFSFSLSLFPFRLNFSFMVVSFFQTVDVHLNKCICFAIKFEVGIWCIYFFSDVVPSPSITFCQLFWHITCRNWLATFILVLVLRQCLLHSLSALLKTSENWARTNQIHQ